MEAVKDIASYGKIDNMFGVQDKIVLITGGGGLAAMFAEGFAGNGATVILASQTVAKCEAICESLRAKGLDKCEAHALDVSDTASVQALADDICARYGKIDICIHTAALCKLHNAMADGFDELFLRHFEVNMMGTRNIDRIVGAKMAEKGWGRIININTMSNLTVNSPDGFSYGVTKTGVRQITRYYAVTLATKGVTVNEICPVWVDTPMMSSRSKDYWDHCIDQVPMERVANPEDYLGIALYMAGEAGRFMTGQSIYVDGGWSISRVFKFDQNK